MDTQKIAKAISLMNSMILGGEQHSTQSIKIMREAMEEIDKQQVSVEPVVKPEIAEEELRILFRNNSDCYADTWRTENDGSWHEGKTIQALTEDKFIEIIKKQFSV